MQYWWHSRTTQTDHTPPRRASRFVRFPIRDQVQFAKRLSFLISAGIPITDSLAILRDQSRRSTHRLLYEAVLHDVHHGQALSTSLGRYERQFGTFAINLIKIGERGGLLTQNLHYLAEQLQKKQELRQKVIGALIYPALITVATLILSGVLVVFIFPKVIPIFSSLQVELPLTTTIMLWLSECLREYSLLLIGGTILLVTLVHQLNHYSRHVRQLHHRAGLSMPVFGSLLRHYHLTTFCRTLGLLLRSGVNVLEALTITGDTMSNDVYRCAIGQVATAVGRGECVSTALARHPFLFPGLATDLIAVGERTGKLSDTLSYLAELYENETTDRTKNLSHSIEPILMVLMGLIVGFVAVSIITPIYEVTQHLEV